MEKFKNYLLAALGFLVLTNVLMMAAARNSNSQGAADRKDPFQIQLDLSSGKGTFTVPGRRLLVIEHIAVSEANFPQSFIELKTVAGGNPGTYRFPNSTLLYALDNRGIENERFSNTRLRLYADPGSVVSVGTLTIREGGDPTPRSATRTVTLSGYLTRSL